MKILVLPSKLCFGVVQKVQSLRRGGGRGSLKSKQKWTVGGGVLACLLKKMLRFSKWSFTVIFQFFLLIIMAVWNIKQIIMKDYNIQSCQWMVCDYFWLLSCTNGAHFIKIPLWLVNIYVEFNQRYWYSLFFISKFRKHRNCGGVGKFQSKQMYLCRGLRNKQGQTEKGGGGGVKTQKSWATKLF